MGSVFSVAQGMNPKRSVEQDKDYHFNPDFGHDRSLDERTSLLGGF